MTVYLQCGRILGVTRDNRMVLCELPLDYPHTECATEVMDYTPIEEF